MGLKGSVVALVEEEDFVLLVCSRAWASVCVILTIHHSQLLFGLPLEEPKLVKHRPHNLYHSVLT